MELQIYLIVFTVIFVWYLQFLFKRKRIYQLAAQYNGPPTLPFIGNALKILIPLTDITDKLLEGCSYYTSPTRLWFGPYLTIQIWDPENARIVLNSPHALEKQPYLSRVFENISGHGLLTSPVSEWKRHRKLISPGFNQKYLTNYFDVFSAHSDKLVENVRNKCNKGIFDVQEFTVKYAIEGVMDTLLDFSENKNISVDTRAMSGWLQSIWEAISTRMTTAWYFFDFIFKKSAACAKLKNAKAKFDHFLLTLINEWQDESLKKHDPTDTSEPDPYRPKKLIDHLRSISNGNGKFSIEELHGEVNNILIAGLETISSTLGYALILLGIHPDIQEKVYQEIMSIVGDKPHLEYDDLKQLLFLERVINETLRLFPGIVGIARYSDQEIPLVNHTIPAKTTIMISLMALHRDPRIWQNPTQFNPDRFLPEEEAKRHSYSWMPFLAGPRNCIAIKYSYISMKIVLATFLRHYRVSTDYTSVEDIHLTMMTVFKPTNGYKISITPR